jgi:phytanoyl-CoA hydroxylase
LKLTQKQINQFKEDGFILLKNFASHDLCEKILEKANVHLTTQQAPIESEQEYMNSSDNTITVRRLRQVYEREEIFQEWMTYEKIRPILEQLLVDTPVLTLAHHNSIMTKMPHESTRTFWHQDRRYWHYENDNLVSVWLSTENEFLENGVLEFIPASHKIKFEKSSFDIDSNFVEDNVYNQTLIKTKVHQTLNKGDVVLFHCKTLHHANKNQTNNPKISFVYTVRGENNKPLKNTRSDFKEITLK